MRSVLATMPNQLLQWTGQLVTPFTSETAAPICPATERRRWAALRRCLQDEQNAVQYSVKSLGY